MLCPRRMKPRNELQHHVAGRSSSSRQREQLASMRVQHKAVLGPLPSTDGHRKGSNRRS